jgi:hypothetical protein
VSKDLNPREDYLARLEDLLPAREVARAREDVEALILERAAGEEEREPGLAAEEAERRAIAALGTPERLAEELVSAPLTIPLATRRTFQRLFAAVFACHLLLSIALTVAGSKEPPIPGLLGALPQESFASIFLGVLSIFLIDAGALFVVFVVFGKARPESTLPTIMRGSRWTRRGAIEGLVLLVLLAILTNAYVERIFSVKHGSEFHTFLAPELLALLPWVNLVLALFALRHILTLCGRANSALSFAADALGSLVGCVLLVAAITRNQLVKMPTSHTLGEEAAGVLDRLTESVFLIVFVVGALLLMLRFVRQAIAFSRSVRA